MNEEEKLVKDKLEGLGYSVIKLNMDGLPDFLCIRNNKKVFIEVKSENDALHINQIMKIINLISKGFEVYLCLFITQTMHLIKLDLQFRDIQEIKLADIDLKNILMGQMEDSIINVRKWLNLIVHLSNDGHLSKIDFEEMRTKCLNIINSE